MAIQDKMDMSNFRAIVLIAVDDSEPAEFAFSWYRDYIHRPDYYTVLLHCTDSLPVQTNTESSPKGTRKGGKEMAERIKKIEDKFGRLMEMNEIIGKIRKGSGKPGEAIVRAAIEEGATMIVTGTRGLGKLKRALLGSVSDHVVHNSPVPVIICRRH